MSDLGAVDAINLDGGGSASLVVGGKLVNTPREEHGIVIPGRPRDPHCASVRPALSRRPFGGHG